MMCIVLPPLHIFSQRSESLSSKLVQILLVAYRPMRWWEPSAMVPGRNNANLFSVHKKFSIKDFASKCDQIRSS